MSFNFTIVGLFDCPWFAKGCIMARMLTERDPTLQFTIEMKKNVTEWEDFCTWMEETQGWKNLPSPVIYENIHVETTAGANLIGSIDDFCEYVNLVFCFCYHISTCEIELEVCRNIKALEDQESTLNDDGFIISIVDPDLTILQLLLPQLCKMYSQNTVVDETSAQQLIIRVCTSSASDFKDLQTIALEVQDSALPCLRYFEPCRTLEDCLKNANAVLLMQDLFPPPQLETARSDFDQKLQDLAKPLNHLPKPDCFILVAPNSCLLGCAIAEELRRLIPCTKVANGALVALGQHAVTKAKAEIARRTKLTLGPGAVKRLQVWGWPGMGGAWVYTLQAMVEDAFGPIRGPVPVLRPFEHMTSEAWWVYNEFGPEFLKKQQTEHLKSTEGPNEGPCFYSPMCIADAIVTTLEAWFASVHPVQSSCKTVAGGGGDNGCRPDVFEDVKKVALPVFSVGLPYRGGETLIPQGTFLVQPSVCYNNRWWPMEKTTLLSQQTVWKALGKLWRESIMSHAIYESLQGNLPYSKQHQIPLSPAEEEVLGEGGEYQQDYFGAVIAEDDDDDDGGYGP